MACNSLMGRAGCVKKKMGAYPASLAGGTLEDHSMVNAIENAVSFPVTFSQGRR